MNGHYFSGRCFFKAEPIELICLGILKKVGGIGIRRFNFIGFTKGKLLVSFISLAYVFNIDRDSEGVVNVVLSDKAALNRVTCNWAGDDPCSETYADDSYDNQDTDKLDAKGFFLCFHKNIPLL